MDSLTIASARDELGSLPERLAQRREAVAVTQEGKPVLAILPWDLYESIAETLDILADDVLVTSLKQGIRETQEGRAIPWNEARATLDR